MGAYDDRPYEVGKGKPPKDTQWRPGKSGNPKGRRRKAVTEDAGLTELLASEIHAKVPVTIDGKVVWLTQKELIIKNLVRDAFAGSPMVRHRALDTLIKLNAFDLKPSDKVLSQEEKDANIAAVVQQLADEARKDMERAIAHADKLIDPLWPVECMDERVRLGLARRREPHEMANYTPHE